MNSDSNLNVNINLTDRAIENVEGNSLFDQWLNVTNKSVNLRDV